MMDNGRVVIGSMATHNRRYNDGTGIFDNLIYYQESFSNYSCSYDPLDALFGNVSWVDSTDYKPMWLDAAEGNTARDPQVVTQWDGSNTIVHLAIGENSAGTALTGDHFTTTNTYLVWSYFRKVGNTFDAGSWEEPQILDSIWFVWTSLAAEEFPGENLAFVYTNETYYGGLLDNSGDVDVWCRESFNRGVDWNDSYSVTNYTNAIGGDPNHFTAWLEAGCMFDQDGDLHVYWTAKPTSDNPYFDGFNWNDFDENVYHFEKADKFQVPDSENPVIGDIVKVANGNFMLPGMLTGSMNTFHCGFGSSNVGYLGWITMGQCNDNLYIAWAQIHERANRFPWRNAATQPAPGVLDDCSYTGARLAMANWEILMSVAKNATSSLWDAPRNISNTYTPNCGVEGDPEGDMPCASEWKPAFEKYALDETGFTGELTWPAEAIVDMTPDGEPAYDGSWYLNMEYMDDRFPGPWIWTRAGGGRDNPPGTENSVKWIRLACVNPIEASQIEVEAPGLFWPSWVETGQSSNITVLVRNSGNVVLQISNIAVDDGGGGWGTPSTSSMSVPAGVVNTATFDVIVDASGYSTPTWLDGTLTITSDADNAPTLEIPIHLLAAAHVEPVFWDTVTTHTNMFDIFFEPEGECVALGVGNQGDLGYGAFSAGSINLDYVESGLECGLRGRDGFYLIGASAFTILADDAAGTNAELTQVFNDANQVDDNGFDPIGTVGSMANGEQLSTAGTYDSTYTGRFVNRDTTIAMERTVYGPRLSGDETLDPGFVNFMVVYTKVYSASAATQTHVTVGNVVDWDIPADSVPNNNSAVAGDEFLYLTGTDTTGSVSCQSNTGRFATEAFGGSYTAAELLSVPCVEGTENDGYYGVSALIQTDMVDTTHYRDGTDLIPDGPMPDVWWENTSAPGLNAFPDLQNQDVAVWLTVAQDATFAPTDTLHYWTVLTTTRDGDLADLTAQVTAAKCWYGNTVLGYLGTECEVCTGCCEGMVGDANNSGEDMPTIGDVSLLIDVLFIGQNWDLLVCLDECDVNQSGGTDPQPGPTGDITIGDVSMLIDFLFITGPSNWDPPEQLYPCL
jgi:hypothetical protein